MGDLAAERTELTRLTLPRRGLDELLRGWSSDGQVFEALGAVAGDDTEVSWSARDVQRRAHRVLLDRVQDDVRRLPSSAASWQEYLPVTVAATRVVSERPVRPMDWAATARRSGWPPRSFVGNPRSRARDETTLQVLVWTARKLDVVRRDARASAPLLVERVDQPISALTQVAEVDIDAVAAIRPDRLDVRALATSGMPWSSLAAVAEALLAAETDLEFLAYQLIEPSQDLQWRMFHLSVFGEVLAALRGHGGRVRWNAPLTASSTTGPQFHVNFGPVRWDLWFEASAALSYYRSRSPYVQATAGVPGNQQTIGADVMLCLPGSRALTLECKWSPNRTYVGRDGYHQASSYLVEARAGVAHDAWSYVVGPEEVVVRRTYTQLLWPGGAAELGVCSIGQVEELVDRVLHGEQSTKNR
jgi:hypothetical protein